MLMLQIDNPFVELGRRKDPRRIPRSNPRLLVHQVRDWYSGAAAYFGRMREAKRENTRCGLRPMSDKAAGQKTRGPEGCDENGPAPALLLVHVSIQICSLVAPCRLPILIATPLYQPRTWCTSHLRVKIVVGEP